MLENVKFSFYLLPLLYQKLSDTLTRLIQTVALFVTRGRGSNLYHRAQRPRNLHIYPLNSNRVLKKPP